MRVVFDTNVILDAVLERADYKSAQALVLAAAADQIDGVITANSITDIYYIARKFIGDQGARQMVANVLTVFDIAEVNGEICAMALNVPMSDYEDAVLAICAAREEADYIATGDQGLLKADSPVQVRTPAQILHLISAIESESE